MHKTKVKSQAVPGGYKWMLVAVLFVVASLNYGDRAILNAVFPLLRKNLGMSDLALGATSTFFLWSYALASPFTGYLGDRFSRRSVITWGLAAWSLIIILNGLAATEAQLLWLRIPLGITESFYVPASLALIADYHSRSTVGRAMSIHLCGFYTGTVAFSAFSGYLADLYGWRSPLIVLGLVGLGYAVFAGRTLRDAPASVRSPDSNVQPRPMPIQAPSSLMSVFRIPTYWILAAEAFLGAAVGWILITWLPLFFHEVFHMSLGKAGFQGTFALQAGNIIGVLSGGFFSDFVAKKNKRHRMLFQLLCDFVSAPLLLVFLLAPSVLVINVGLFAYSLIRYMGGASANPLLCDLIEPERRSVAFGVTNLTNCFSGGAAILLAGMLKESVGLTAIFAFISVLTVIAGMVLLIGYRFFLQRDLERYEKHVQSV